MYIRSAIISLDSEDLDTRQRLANTSKNPRLLARLANDEDPSVVYNVIRNSSTSNETLLHICDNLLDGKYDSDGYHLGHVVNSLLYSSKVPSDMVHSIWTQYPSYINQWTVDTMIRRADCPEDILEAIAQNGNEQNRTELAAKPNLSDHIADILSQDKSIKVRAALAENSSISDELLEKLRHDRRKEVRTAAAANSKSGTSGVENIIKNGTYKDIRGIYSSAIKTPYLCALLSMRRDLPDYMYGAICYRLGDFFGKHPESLNVFKPKE